MILLSEGKIIDLLNDYIGSGAKNRHVFGKAVAKEQIRVMVEWLKEFDRKHHSDNGGNLFCSACEDEIWEALEKEIK